MPFRAVFFASLLPALCLLAAGLSASEARELGFGPVNAFIVSDSSYDTLPQVVDTTSGSATLELGDAPETVGQAGGGGLGAVSEGLEGPDKAWGGVNIPFGAGALGVWFGRADNDFAGLYGASQLTAGSLPAAFVAGMDRLDGLAGVGAASTVASFDAAQPPSARVDLLYAFEWNPRLTLALGLNRSNLDQELNYGAQGSDSYDAQNLGLSLGADIKGVWIAKLLQVGLQINAESLAAEANDPGVGDDKLDSSATGLALRVGADIPGQGASFGRVELGFKTGFLSVQSLDGVASRGSESGSDGLYNLGYALGLSQDRGMALCGLMLNGSFGGDGVSGGNAQDYNAEALVLSLGGEFKIREWLTARGGLSSSLASAGSLSQSPGPSLGSPSYSASNSALAGPGGLGVAPAGSAQAALGLSLNLGDLTVDGSVSQGLDLAGSALANGLPADLFGDVSVTWDWE